MLPNFLIIGSAKSGTTSLYKYLKQHPEVYMSPIKETEFFVFEGEQLDFRVPEHPPRQTITRLEDYVNLFQGVTTETAVGEVCPAYLYYYAKAAARIKKYTPQAGLVVILRNPVDRAYSQFLHLLRDGYETKSDFNTALAAEEGRIADHWAWGWHYTRVGYYYRQLKYYYELFPENQISVFLYRDFKNNPEDMLKRLFRFLRVNDGFVPDMDTRYNISGVPRNAKLHDFLSKPNRTKKVIKKLMPARSREKMRLWLKNRNMSRPELDQGARRRLIGLYKEDVMLLEKLIKRDLSGWLKEPTMVTDK